MKADGDGVLYGITLAQIVPLSASEGRRQWFYGPSG